MALSQLFQQAQQLQIVRDVDLALLDLFQRQESENLDDSQVLAILLVSRHSAMGHVCVDLRSVLADPLAHFGLAAEDRIDRELLSIKRQFEAQLIRLIASINLAQWMANITSCKAVEAVSDSSRSTSTPLVLDSSHGQSLLYLSRYWHSEQLLASFIGQRSGTVRNLPEQAQAIVANLFPQSLGAGASVDWQRAAVALSARSNFSIITGGPGTGKTTTVLRLLALLQAIQLEQQLPALHIKLAAPTGKAAARLNESIASNLQRQSFPDGQHVTGEQLRMAIPSEVTTLHRLLGTVPNSRQFRHHASNPLAADIVVVDEASMVDLEMMAALVQALDKHTRLILIGDKDQLASVEAGSVLGDLCSHASAGNYKQSTVDWLRSFTGDVISPMHMSEQGSTLAQTTTMLRVSHRFQQGGSIHALASLVNEGLYEGQPTLLPWQDLQAIVAQEQALAIKKKREPQLLLLQQSAPLNAGTSHKAVSSQWLNQDVAELLTSGYSQYLQLVRQGPQDNSNSSTNDWAAAVLAAHSQFQLLVALRQGEWGLQGMNKSIQALLQQAHMLDQDVGGWYVGRPVMVVRNDYHLKLMNGDIGICLPYRENATDEVLLRVVFSDGAGGVRWVLPSRLRAVETVFAMTVHKSQGSEFRHTLLMLPNRSNPVLTKELLYTGITRAKDRFSLIYGSEEVLEQAMTKRVQRSSGLMKRLGCYINII